MITKAIIEKVISDYEVKVRIPLLDSTTAFKQSVDIDGLSSATICISPKSRFIPAVGDIVFVAFEDNDAGKPVIIGCLQKETGNISSLDLNVESLNASSSINLSNNTTIGDLSYEKINSLFDIKDQEIDELKKRDIVKLYDAVGQNIDGAMTQKATTDSLAKKMDNFSISIGSTNGGNPRQVKFMSINYTTATSEAGVSIKLSMVSGHGNGSSYRFLQDAILGVTYTGVVSIDVYKYYNASVGTFDGAARNYGDIFYVKDETNKIVDFYVLLGQYSTVKVTPYFRLNSSTGGVITQLSGAPTYYSSGTKVYGNNSLYAKNSDIPNVSQSTGTSTTDVMSQKATTDAIPTKISQLTNDSSFATTDELASAKEDVITKVINGITQIYSYPEPNITNKGLHNTSYTLTYPAMVQFYIYDGVNNEYGWVKATWGGLTTEVFKQGSSGYQSGETSGFNFFPAGTVFNGYKAGVNIYKIRTHIEYNNNGISISRDITN